MPVAEGTTIRSLPQYDPARTALIQPGRETVLHDPGHFRLTIPPFSLLDQEGSPLTEAFRLQVQHFSGLTRLFSQGMHTFVDGQCMGLAKVIRVHHPGTNTHFHPPIICDLPGRKRLRRCQAYHWVSAAQSEKALTGSWRALPPVPSHRYRPPTKDHHQFPVWDSSYTGLLYPITQNSPGCMLTVRISGPLDPGRIRMFIRLKALPAFGPVPFFEDRWAAVGLPTDLPATVFALGNSNGRWYLGQTDLPSLQNQRLVVHLRGAEKDALLPWLSQILQ